MCGRYSFPEKDESPAMSAILSGLAPGELNVKTGEVCPGDTAAVIARSRRLEPRLFAMGWGYRLSGGKLVFNTRCETAAEKPLFRDGFTQRRCLIPTLCYYEWEKTGTGKLKHSIAPAGAEVFYLAGIYRLEGGQPEFSVLTRSAAPEIAFIHDRMPVIIPPELITDWLDPAFNAGDIIAAIHPSMAHSLC